MKKHIPALILLLCLTITRSVTAATISVPASKDNAFGLEGDISNGAGDFIRVGENGAGDPRRGLIRFELANTLPTNVVITNVTLQLNVLPGSLNEVPTANVALHRLLADWGEGTNDAFVAATPGEATWTNSFFNTVFWTTPGGDFNPAPSATVPVGTNGLFTWSSASLISDVQLWQSNPNTNFGWILIGDETTPFTVKHLCSRTYPTLTQQPNLVIDYYLTNTIISPNTPTKVFTNVVFDKLIPKDTKKLSFKVAKGFKAKGRLIRTDASGTNTFSGDIYAFFKSGEGTNANQTAAIKLIQKPTIPKKLAAKGVLAIFKSDKTTRVGVGANPVNKDTAVQVVFFASNSSGVLYKTNNLTAKNIK